MRVPSLVKLYKNLLRDLSLAGRRMMGLLGRALWRGLFRWHMGGTDHKSKKTWVLVDTLSGQRCGGKVWLICREGRHKDGMRYCPAENVFATALGVFPGMRRLLRVSSLFLGTTWMSCLVDQRKSVHDLSEKEGQIIIASSKICG